MQKNKEYLFKMFHSLTPPKAQLMLLLMFMIVQWSR